jgi:hypothetical protein
MLGKSNVLMLLRERDLDCMYSNRSSKSKTDIIKMLEVLPTDLLFVMAVFLTESQY